MTDADNEKLSEKDAFAIAMAAGVRPKIRYEDGQLVFYIDNIHIVSTIPPVVCVLKKRPLATGR